MEFFGHAESWVLVSFILFLALLAYLKVPAMLGKMLDERSAKIAKDLDDAKNLRTEAAALLDEYKKKRADAEKQAQDILSSAKADAEAYGVEAKRKLSEALDRRAKQAEQKIAQAETAAIKDVRNAATDLAIGAATKTLKDRSKGAGGEGLIDESVNTVKNRLN
jgi:F-type H+-transporting ATPase subunit b